MHEKFASKNVEPEVSLQRLDGAPDHFESRISSWIQCLLVAGSVVLSLYALDAPIAAWAYQTHPIPNWADRAARHGDIARELMVLEQWGHVVASVAVVFAVFLLDKDGGRRSVSIAMGCLASLLVSHFLKDLFGRSRPTMASELGLMPGQWSWGGPVMGFQSSYWNSFPSGHTIAAFSLSSGLAWFYPRGRLLFMGLACITGAQRVLNHTHYVSDVLAGMGVGVFVTRWTLRMHLPARLIARFGPMVEKWWLSRA